MRSSSALQSSPRAAATPADRQPEGSGTAEVNDRRVPRHSDIRELSPEGARRSAHAGPRRSAAAVTNTLNRALVGIYKLAGFSLLSIILFGLFAYVSLNGLFFLHEAWISPAIIAPADPRVIELRARLAHEVWNRQRVEAERAEVRSKVRHAQRTIGVEHDYQQTFRAAVSENASFQRGRLHRVRSLREEIDTVQRALDEATERFAFAHGQALTSAYDARLINQEQKATGDYRLAELEARQIALQGQKATITGQLEEISLQLRALGTVAADPSAGIPATVEGLELKRSYMNSVLEAQKAEDTLVALGAADSALGEAIKGYDTVISIIQESPLLLAASGQVTVAFVPYDNLRAVKSGAPVFGCAAYVVWCKQVGRVGKAIDGEVVAKHPMYGTELRGTFVRLELHDPEWAKEAVLHVGRAPLWL